MSQDKHLKICLGLETFGSSTWMPPQLFALTEQLVNKRAFPYRALCEPQNHSYRIGCCNPDLIRLFHWDEV